MTDIEITTRINSTFLGAWHPSDHPRLIWLNIRELWDWAAHNSPLRAEQDEIENIFMEKLNKIFIQELACIFKSEDKLRIKGGSCEPFCHHEFLVDLMSHPDEWQEIREHHRKKRILYLEGDD